MQLLNQKLSELLASLKIAPAISEILLLIIPMLAVFLLAYLVSKVTNKVVVRAVKKLTEKSKTHWDDYFLKRKVFERFISFAPAIIIYSCLPQIVSNYEILAAVFERVIVAYMVLLVLLTIDGVLSAVHDIYKTFDVSRVRPINSIVQLLKVILYLVGLIFIVAVLIDKSPVVLFSSLGAMTAVLMLVFKDSILGFVASIQLAANNMVRPGDWIEMPKYGADGDVLEVTLNTVKVQNWDKTISTIPTYSLITDTFKNWRGMSEGSGRRIKRAISLDMNSVGFCTEDQIEYFKKFDLLKDYIAQRQNEIEDHNAKNGLDNAEVPNGRCMTNLGVFRAYLESFLKQNQNISKDLTFLVRQLAPGDSGIPIEIYVFSTDKRWVQYEAIQSDIFDHILSVLPHFGLRVFQSPTGYDFRQQIEG